jgi:hypothetical protein
MGVQKFTDVIVNGILGRKESFENKAAEEMHMGKEFMRGVIELIVAGFIILLSGLLVKFLWNNSMPYMFATARPVSSVLTMYAFMLMVFFVL